MASLGSYFLSIDEPQGGLPALQGAVSVLTPRLLPKHRPLPALHPLPVWWTQTCSHDNSNSTLTARQPREVATLPPGAQNTHGESSSPTPTSIAVSWVGRAVTFSLRALVWVEKMSFGSEQGREKLRWSLPPITASISLAISDPVGARRFKGAGVKEKVSRIHLKCLYMPLGFCSGVLSNQLVCFSYTLMGHLKIPYSSTGIRHYPQTPMSKIHGLQRWSVIFIMRLKY